MRVSISEMVSLVAILPAVGIGEVGLSDLGHIGDGHLGGVQDDSVLYGANSRELHDLGCFIEKCRKLSGPRRMATDVLVSVFHE